MPDGGVREQLGVAGYQHVTQVVSPGEVCFRGGLIDLFPMGSALPYRIDLDDDVIETIRTFDVDTQRTLYSVNEIRMLPAREFPLDDAGRARFRSRWRELFEGEAALTACLRQLKARGTTVVIVSHRPSTLGIVDRVLVLKGGTVAAFGPREEVLRQFTRPARVATAEAS